MALTIRFRQIGKKNRQTYRLVVTDKRNPRDGKYVELLGWYNPFAKEDKSFLIKEDRIQYWLSQGAELSFNAKTIINKAAPQIIKEQYEKTLAKKKKLKAKAKPKVKAKVKAEKKEKPVKKVKKST